MRAILMIVFGLILAGMLVVTTYASLHQSILKIPAEVTTNPWLHATLADAYFGFLTFYCWVWYKEPTLVRRALWFVFIMLLGNIAMAIYMLWQLWTWQTDDGVAGLLLRRDHASDGGDIAAPITASQS